MGKEITLITSCNVILTRSVKKLHVYIFQDLAKMWDLGKLHIHIFQDLAKIWDLGLGDLI